jgi:hypothetical protein
MLSLKIAQFDLYKCIIWPKKLRKGRQEWKKACGDLNIPQRKLNTLVKIRLLSKI